MDFGLDPFHAAPSLAGGEGPEDASAAVAFLEAGRVSAFLRHGFHDGADDAEEESVGEIGEEGARGVFFHFRTLQRLQHLCNGILLAGRPEEHRPAVHQFDFVHVDHDCPFFAKLRTFP